MRQLVIATQLALGLIFLHLKKIIASLGRFFSNDHVQSLRQAMVWTLPCAMMSAIFVAIAFILDVMHFQSGLSQVLKQLNAVVLSFIPMVVATSLTYILSVKKRLPPMPVSTLALISILMIRWRLTLSFDGAMSLMVLIGIVVPFITVPIVKSLYGRKLTVITSNDYAGNNVKVALNLTIPGMIVLILIFLGIEMLGVFVGYLSKLGLLSGLNVEPSYSGAALYTVLNSMLWFVGVHGANVLQPLLMHLNEVSSFGGGAVNESFMGAFVFIGGAGATLSLIVAIVIFSKNNTLRLLAFTSIPIGMLNINEVLIHGFPIILNPRMLVPFIATPLVNAIIALFVINLGWVAMPDAEIPLNSLVGINAYIATHHDVHAVFLQMFNVLVGTLIYGLFINNKEKVIDHIHFKSLDMTYAHLNEEASVFSYDPISATAELRKKLTYQKKHMERLAGLDFYLEYQPQITPHNQKLVGVEALIRARDADNKIWAAGEFLPWFEDASMMKSIDLWVVNEAIKQDAEWQSLGLDLGIKINVSSETLKHKETMDLLIEKLAVAKGRVSIEIVEQEFLGELNTVVESIRRIQSIGAKVYIDDFGTGYSSLSYLNLLKVDCIKVDRNFVLELEKPEGQKVMAGIFNFAEALGLELIVEGVETKEQLAKIPKQPLFAVQGWLYSKSLNPSEIPAFAAKFNHFAAA